MGSFFSNIDITVFNLNRAAPGIISKRIGSFKVSNGEILEIGIEKEDIVAHRSSSNFLPDILNALRRDDIDLVLALI